VSGEKAADSSADGAVEGEHQRDQNTGDDDEPGNSRDGGEIEVGERRGVARTPVSDR